MTQLQTRALRYKRMFRYWSLQRILIVLIAVMGVGLLLYPAAAAWFSDRVHATEISGYVATVDGVAQADKQALLAQARAYNAELPAGPLRDPYSLNEKGEQTSIGSGSDAYKAALSTGNAGIIGLISIPSIKSSLPIFHGTDDATLAKGVGHLFGSSLPVGGIGTHSVLTAHSGFVNATLFDDLEKVALGDVFSVTVLNETINYKVDKVQTVLPEDTEALRQVKGKDYITLITCTPTGINSHRLLVRGERTTATDTVGDGSQTLPSSSTDPGFPWWALTLAGTAVGAFYFTRPRGQRVSTVKKKASRSG